jgi:hypothetical protein
MSLDAFVDAIATKFECDKAELRVIVQKAMVDAKFLETTLVTPVVSEKKGSKGSPTIYSQFIHYWNVQLQPQLTDHKVRQQTYVQMWKALSPAEQKAWIVPGGAVVSVGSKPAVRRQTGYQLFQHAMKNSKEILAVASGSQRSKKMGEMWQALKGAPVEGQDYWNTMAKKVEEVPTTEQLPVVVPPVVEAITEIEVDEVDEADEVDEEREDDE